MLTPMGTLALYRQAVNAQHASTAAERARAFRELFDVIDSVSNDQGSVPARRRARAEARQAVDALDSARARTRRRIAS